MKPICLEVPVRSNLVDERARHASEALTNAAKHGEGPISVRVDESSDALRFSVTDAGSGFDPAARSGGAGLDNMEDRLDVLGGRLTIDSAPGMSTTVSGEIPAPVSVPAG